MIIDISEEIYEHAIERSEDSNDEYNALRAIEKGNPLDVEDMPCVTQQFYPPCEDCNKKMDEIRRAYDKLQDRPTEWTREFAEWVAREIFDDMWEYNKDAFAEIACRKLAKLGIVREKGDEWELVELQESEEE